jgi:hypothetical protein
MNVYVIQHGDQDICKIGVSVNPSERLAQLQTANPMVLSLIASFPFDKMETALLVEQLLHNQFQYRCLRGEWFGVHPFEVVHAYQLLKNTLDAVGNFADVELHDPVQSDYQINEQGDGKNERQ